jgi:hypothetical protein
MYTHLCVEETNQKSDHLKVMVIFRQFFVVKKYQPSADTVPFKWNEQIIFVLQAFDNKHVTFEEHIRNEHNMWHYLYFIVLIKA